MEVQALLAEWEAGGNEDRDQHRLHHEIGVRDRGPGFRKTPGRNCFVARRNCAKLGAMIFWVFSCSFSLILVFCLVPGFAQTHTPTPAQPKTASVAPASAPAVPIDPKKLMAQASRLNGLSSDGMQPWHLKANYQTFDAGGKPKDKGVFEEWWAGPEKYKVSYTSSGFNQVRYKTHEKLLMTGDDSAPTLSEAMLKR